MVLRYVLVIKHIHASCHIYICACTYRHTKKYTYTPINTCTCMYIPTCTDCIQAYTHHYIQTSLLSIRQHL